MDNSKLALLLGMMCGDGCLTIRTRKEGYKTYAVEFHNTELDKINLFQNLFSGLFGIQGNYHPEKGKDKRKIAYAFRSYSKEIFSQIASLGFPIGLKKYKLRIPDIVWNFNRNEKMLFIKGVIITDGSIRKQGNVLFHMGSKDFLDDLSNLIYELFELRKGVKEYIQKEKYFSYQLLLDKKQSQEILNSKM
ncbi:hypothetical protein HOD29_03260 [archaeon]|jgi:hypothetical protein|nr:hypothetical protein [archaeon]